jgi:hypothetical protein
LFAPRPEIKGECKQTHHWRSSGVTWANTLKPNPCQTKKAPKKGLLPSFLKGITGQQQGLVQLQQQEQEQLQRQEQPQELVQPQGQEQLQGLALLQVPALGLALGLLQQLAFQLGLHLLLVCCTSCSQPQPIRPHRR